MKGSKPTKARATTQARPKLNIQEQAAVSADAQVRASIDVVAAVVQAKAVEMRASGIEPKEIRVATWEAVEVAIPHLPAGRRAELELQVQGSLDEILDDQEEHP
jgi:hypothetical protein